ncbi:hypothetical protein EVAR_64415_1 [Eumeta japonica]|uniref:Uncharacterized protein n=1 Tax=Eumeta variegata TaxID=151549 RepID=A0A4C1ZXK1_EUMVA|nr:hypothetical protein EVAR_64415_1 [Eumeta japonica]
MPLVRRRPSNPCAVGVRTAGDGSESWVWQKKINVGALQRRYDRYVECVECLGKIDLETVMLNNGVVGRNMSTVERDLEVENLVLISAKRKKRKPNTEGREQNARAGREGAPSLGGRAPHTKALYLH